jgi:N,N'-diacetylchitobiose transport system permease protein
MTWVWRALALALGLVTLFPVYWMVQSAFEPNSEITSLTPSYFPVHFTFHNFADAVNHTAGVGQSYFWDDARNSLFVVGTATAVTLVFAFLAAAAISRFRLIGTTAFLVMILVVQMVPGTAMIIPTFLFLNQLHLTDNYLGLILAYSASTLPFTVWALKGFVRGVPFELEEAAMVDGASRLGAFVRILLPLVAPGLVATSVFTFITSWNEFIFANTLLSTGSTHTITLWLSEQTGGQRAIDWGALMAASTLISIPVVIFFLLVQRRIAYGLTAGAVKA